MAVDRIVHLVAGLMAEFRKAHQFVVFCVNHPMQLALAEFKQDREHTLGRARSCGRSDI